MKCTKCGAEQEADVKFCTQCGAPMEHEDQDRKTTARSRQTRRRPAGGRSTDRSEAVKRKNRHPAETVKSRGTGGRSRGSKSRGTGGRSRM